MSIRLRTFTSFTAILLVIASLFSVYPSLALAAGATTSVYLVKYDRQGKPLKDRTVGYEWMEENLEVYGDGETHYYHQGPIFEGDPWDPDRTRNLKDKGAVKGSAVKDLCDLVGGMSEGDEVMFVGVDGWHTKFGFSNIYDPPRQQGTIALCWFNGRDGEEGERYGAGYPGNNAYSTALQIVFLSKDPNADGKYVFGNIDMKTSLPQEKYQYFFEGEFPSTNGLSGKWISEVRVYEGGVPQDVRVDKAVDQEPRNPAVFWLPLVSGSLGLALVGFYFFTRRKAR